ncbi:hypothetical protein Dimus_011596, partial [Dionaea muscipula]
MKGWWSVWRWCSGLLFLDVIDDAAEAVMVEPVVVWVALAVMGKSGESGDDTGSSRGDEQQWSAILFARTTVDGLQ